MKTHTRVAVIGGGVTGCSILYHLAKSGWSDVVLIERQELTSGSSWHAVTKLYVLHLKDSFAADKDGETEFAAVVGIPRTTLFADSS